jgi:acetolactate decarboxylase
MQLCGASYRLANAPSSSLGWRSVPTYYRHYRCLQTTRLSKGRLCILWIGVGAAIALGCSPAQNAPARNGTKPAAARDRDTLAQFSLLASLAADNYVGEAPLRDVLEGGDFGVGTFDRLDGEMIVLDGQMYQALADGTVRMADLEGTTPFAAVTFFKEDGRIDHVAAATLDDLDKQLDLKLLRRNSPYAIRITGDFSELTLRSVSAQSPPFRPLVEVVKQQVTWQHRNLRGTLVGLRCPHWMGTLNVSGYHWHFLSDDRKIGGHVLACEFQRGSLLYDECTSVIIHLPQSTEFDGFDASDVTEQDVNQIERQRTQIRRP